MSEDLSSEQTDVVAPPVSDVERMIGKYESEEASREAQENLGTLIQPKQYVGEVFSLGYDTALVQIHDSHRQDVGGIPSLSFLIATRLAPDQQFDFRHEDSSIILLRVMDSAPLPNDDEATRVRVQAAQQVAGPREGHWDDASVMDYHTARLLSFAGVRCRVIGTFYLNPSKRTDGPRSQIRFGADLSNYYPNRGLKVYKPNGEALRRIVNYRESGGIGVGIGEVRYASTDRAFQGVREVPVTVIPQDLLGQKSALFGMTRTGKSNTTKIIAKAVFDLRHGPASQRVGQIIFDPNGEYANANAQDSGGQAPNALKNVWRAHKNGKSEDVITYGILGHPNDPNRKMMLINFYEDSTIEVGKSAIDGVLEDESSIYFKNFIQVRLGSVPANNDYGSSATRARRRILAYRALLARAGFKPPKSLPPRTKRLFSKELLKAMRESQSDNAGDYLQGATLLGLSDPTWDQVATAMGHLDAFIHEKNSGYTQFDNWYMTNRDGASGDPWADEDLKKVLRMFGYANGARRIADARPFHTDEVGSDFADDIYHMLLEGKLVIVDQSSGDEDINDASARRIVRRIFDGNKEIFRQGEDNIPDIIVYAEEAHNLLPSDRDVDNRDIWVRMAKEGAKYNLGLIYVTQEVSSIQKNILKNTANWFIGHLNNTDETRELRKFYDFADFEGSILRAQDKGFLRVKTISNPFVVPVQVREFRLDMVQAESSAF